MIYNLFVPTPFYHMSIAYELLGQSELPKKTQEYLTMHFPAFLFGKTAPDVQVITKQKREATHFYTLPPEGKTPAWKRLLDAYPSLQEADAMTEDHAAFVAGYLCHLQADETWIYELFLPVFGPEAGWADFRERLYLHNVLRTYLDKQVLESLPRETRADLQATNSQNWLPFVQDEHLHDWRDYLAQQLEPGAIVKTIDVFANRQGLEPEEFSNLLNSETNMDTEIFAHITRQQLIEFRKQLLAKNLHLLQKYLIAK